MIRALFFDLDGTLLTSDKRLSSATRQALKKLHARGLRLYVATGRSPSLDRTLGWSEADLALFDGGVYSNGACVLQGGQARWAYIAPEAVQACIRLARKHSAHLSLHMADGGHAFNFALPESVRSPWGVNDSNIFPLDDAAARQAVKLLLFHENLVDSVTPLPPALLTGLQHAVGEGVSLYLTDQGRTI